jgi:hypothetical protein
VFFQFIFERRGFSMLSIEVNLPTKLISQQVHQMFRTSGLRPSELNLF